ncbi:MAG: sigma-54-dependent Fis family transcriptional regulator [Proteobacteria bacterium]|nr:sigma-54-dependent Fis family transcriptional regulator [Pseudomonadota bacterium]MCH8187426.1 sigma-54-dependent Fis family transcriptional regulator [Pseudomonadota bacterium]
MARDILIVDDEADIRDLVSGVLQDEGFETRVAIDSVSALAALNSRPPALVVLDIWLEGSDLDGMQLLDVLVADHSEIPVVMISGHGNIETAVAAIKRGAYDFIEKPFKADRLLLVARRAMEAGRLRRENADLRQRAGHESELIGSSQAINAMRLALEKVAPTGSRVLITGPAGSGKEVAARLLHMRSRRSEGPFVVLNAARMAPERMESELFGVEEGADGHDTGRRIGTFEEGHGGTLFIDEVADMPLVTQGKILRVLQEQTFTRLGGTEPVHVDVRVVSASSRDLTAEIAAGRFREDLYHRLNVVPIRVPALHERREDIPVLARHFMHHMAQSIGLPQREICDDAMAVLQAKDWPGNVRELRNMIERLLIMAPGKEDSAIRADMLPPEITAASAAALRQAGNGEIMAMPLREAREQFEREYLLAQINRFGGNISRTASFVGMERSALHRKIKALGVNPNERGANERRANERGPTDRGQGPAA